VVRAVAVVPKEVAAPKEVVRAAVVAVPMEAAAVAVAVKSQATSPRTRQIPRPQLTP
jgi:hypothetical protein